MVLLPISLVPNALICTSVPHHTSTHAFRSCRPRAALPAGWNPSLPLPTGVEQVDGFLGSASDKAEAEAALKVSISSDDTLWASNAFTQYVDAEKDWSMISFDRVVLLVTFLTLKAAGPGKVRAKWERADYYEETIELPIVGQSIFNRWVVHGYVDERRRVCRSTEGNDYGKWSLVTLESDATPTVLKQLVQPQDGAMVQFTFEPRGA